MKKNFSMNHKIEILENINPGSLEEKWQQKYTIYAAITELNEHSIKNIEGSNFGYILSANYLLFTIRFIQDVVINMKIRFRDKFYTIQKVTNFKQSNHFLHLIALEIL